MDSKDLHKETIEIARTLIEKDPSLKDWVIEKFPELEDEESKDESIRKWIVQHFEDCVFAEASNIPYMAYIQNKVLPWLEKQKPANKVEPKFKVGDWIINNDKRIAVPTQILETEEYGYITSSGYTSFDKVKTDYHLWTIQDAKDGNVLYYKSPLNGIEYIVMSRGVNGYGNVDSYFRYNSADGFGTNIPSVFSAKLDDISPATKEQRDLLFQKMKEAGYEWNAEKKELKKIPNALEECEIEHIEHGKYYYCIKDYYTGGNKIASKGEVVQALRGTSMMGLGVKANEYFIPVKCIVDVRPSWSEEDDETLKSILSDLSQHVIPDDEDMQWLKSIKDRVSQPHWKPSEQELVSLKTAISVLTEERNFPLAVKHLEGIHEQLQNL